jgi:TRAP-type mannitol/chloroaromatic compound transport system permease small subunit
MFNQWIQKDTIIIIIIIIIKTIRKLRIRKTQQTSSNQYQQNEFKIKKTTRNEKEFRKNSTKHI